MTFLINELKQNIDSKAILYLKNNFRFEVKIIDCDDDFVKVVDLRNLSIRFFRISEINNLEVENNGS